MAGMSVPVQADSVRAFLSSMPLSSIVSWKMLAILLAIVNIKNIPLIWHLRVFYHFARNIRWRMQSSHFPKGHPITTSNGKPIHPVFVPYGITSRTPILETDYNFHKSNSTYFSDLDVARTALVTRIYSPGVSIISKELDQEFLEKSLKEGKKTPPKRKTMRIALGSVYCSFKREIKPFELYEIESKIVGWDQKWLYTLTFFLRPAKKTGGEKTLLATAVSKYVMKKGRLTVPPERVLRASGFLPPRPEGSSMPVATESVDGSGVGTPANGDGITVESGVDGSLVREVLKLDVDKVAAQATLDAQKDANSASWDEGEWTWERIDQERLRGLELVKGYTTLDEKLHGEFEV